MNVINIAGLETFAPELQALGFSGNRGLEQLLGASQVAGSELAEYLGISTFTFARLINNASDSATSIPMAALKTISHATYSLGASVGDIPRASGVAPGIPPPPSEPPPATVNLVPGMPPVRHQKHRGTCVAYAVLAVYEYYLSANGAYQDMAEQFLYWNCKRSDNHPQLEGTWLAIAAPLLERDGCCLEISWPYVPDPVAGNESQGPPPPGTQLEALAYRSPRFRPIAPNYVDDIKNVLIEGHCVAFSIPVFNSWYGSAWVAYSGEITMPIPGEIQVGGHAMCIVGYVDLPDVGLGGGRFIIRNSWGDEWGLQCQYGVGYGSIPYAYIARMGVEAYSIA